MGDTAALAAAAGTASEELRRLLREESEAIRKEGRVSRWLPVLASLLAALIGGGASYLVAVAKARSDFQSLEQTAQRKIEELERQALLTAGNAAYQRMFDSIFASDDHLRLNRALAVAVLMELVPSERRGGLCRYLVMVDTGAPLRAGDPDPTDVVCRQVAMLVATPPSRERASAAVSGAVGQAQVRAAAISSAEVPPPVVDAIRNLGSPVAAERVAAAQFLGDLLNGRAPLAARIAAFGALSATVQPDVYRALSANARYNTFVVLSEIRPLIADAQRDATLRAAFLEEVGRLRDYTRRVLAEVRESPELVGPQTQRQIDQTLARLPQS
jgi:hypothetical protein